VVLFAQGEPIKIPLKRHAYMTMMKWFVAVVFLASGGIIANGSFINDFTNGLEFFLEPCGNSLGEACVGDWDDVPPEVRSIEICLFEGDGGPGFICDDIGNLVTGGIFSIWSTSCEDIFVEGIGVDHTVNPADDLIESMVSVNPLKVSCTGQVRVQDLVLEIGFWEVTITFQGPFALEQGPGSGVDGISLDLGIDFYAPPGENFANEIVDEVRIPFEKCDLSTDLGLQLQANQNQFENIFIDGPIFDYSGTAALNLIGADNVLLLIATLAEAILGYLTCQILEEAAIFEDTGEPGYLNILLSDFTSYINELASAQGQDVAFSDTDVYLLGTDEYSGLTATELNNAFDFSNSSIFEVISVTLNDFLGSLDQETNSLVVNDLINSLTEPDGEIAIDVEDFLGAPVDVLVPGGVFNLTVTVNSVSLKGLNMIETFQILDNDFKAPPENRLKRTTNNTVELTDITLEFTAELDLAPGDWVTATCRDFPAPNTCATDRSSFGLTYEVMVDSVFFEASVVSVVNPSELEPLQVGQLLGLDLDFDSLDALQACSTPAVYALNITYLRASLGQLTEPVVTSVDDPEFTDLILDATLLVADFLKGGLRTKFPGIANGIIRESINEVLLSDVTIPARENGIAACPAWAGPSNQDPYIIDWDSSVVIPVYSFINEGVGGNPVDNTASDINDLALTLLNFFDDQYSTFPLSNDGLNENDFVLMETKGDRLRLDAVNLTNSFVRISDVTIGNVNSISRLTLDSPASALDVVAGIGGQLRDPDTGLLEPAVPFQISFTLEVQNGTTVDETAILTLDLQDVTAAFGIETLALKLDLLFALYVGNLTHVPCLFATLAAIDFPQASRSLSADNIGLSVVRVQSNSVSGAPLADALTLLESEPASPGLGKLVDTLLDASLDAVLDLIEGLPADFNDLNAVSCVAESDPFNTLTTLIPDLQSLSQECVTAPVSLPTPVENELAVLQGRDLPQLVDFTTSFFVEFYNQLESIAESDTLDTVLTVLANDTSVTLFEFDDEGGISLVLSLGQVLDLTYADPGFTFEIDKLRVNKIRGLLDSIDLLQPVSSLTTRNRIRIDDSRPLSLDLVGAIVFEDEREEVIVDVEIEGFSLFFQLGLGIDSEVLLNQTLGSFLTIAPDRSIALADHALDCLLASIIPGGFQLGILEITAENIGSFNVTSTTNSVISPGTSALLAALADILADFYGPASASISQNCVRPLINSFVESLRSGTSCPANQDQLRPVLEGDERYLKFNDAKLLNTFQDFWNENVASNDYATFNSILAATVDANEYFQGDDALNATLPLTYNGVSYGLVDIDLSAVDVNGFDTFSDLQFLIPIEDVSRRRMQSTVEELVQSNDYRTRTSLRIDGPLLVTGDFRIILDDVFVGQPTSVNDVRLTLSVRELELSLDASILVDLVLLLDVPLSSLESIELYPCLLVPLDALNINDFDFTVANLSLSLECIGNCDIPFLEPFENGGVFDSSEFENFNGLLNDAVAFVADFLDTSGAQDLVDIALTLADDECAKLLGIIEDFVNFPEKDDFDAATIFLFIFLGLSGAVGMGLVVLVPIHRRRKDNHLIEATAGIIGKDEALSAQYLARLHVAPLFFHPNTPQISRFVVPFILVLNIVALVIAIVFSEAANLLVDVTFLGSTTRGVALVPFTLASTINDTWNSGAWPVSVLVAVASCMWPVAKNAILLVFWFLPGTIVNPRTRHDILELLDVLGKWSFLDVYVIVFALAALRTTVEVNFYNSLAFLANGFFTLDVTVKPESGLVLLCAVAAGSLLINHVIIYFHNRNEEYDHLVRDTANGVENPEKPPFLARLRRRAINHIFAGTTKNGLVREVSPLAAKILLGSISLMSLFFLVGVFLPIITFEVNGLIGIILEVITGDSDSTKPLNTKTFSLVSMGALLAEAPTTTTGDSFVIGFFSLLYATSVFLGPFSLCIILVVILTLPLSLKGLQRMLFWTKIASYWSGVEVILLALVLTVFEIELIVQFLTDFITSDVCSQAKGIIEVAVENPEVDGFCFNTVAALQPGVTLLFFAVFLQFIIYGIVSTLVAAIIDDRYFVAYRGIREDVIPRKRNRFWLYVLRSVTRTSQSGLVLPGSSGALVQGPFTVLDNDENDNDSETVESTTSHNLEPSRWEVFCGCGCGMCKCCDESEFDDALVAQWHQRLTGVTFQEQQRRSGAAATVNPTYVGNRSDPFPDGATIDTMGRSDISF